jgi:superfamily II DNA or RNA helicase
MGIKFQPRYYQADCKKAFIQYIEDNLGKNPLLVLPTAAGKSFIQAMIVQWMLEWDNTRVLLITHRKTLIQQNYNKIFRRFEKTGYQKQNNFCRNTIST